MAGMAVAKELEGMIVNREKFDSLDMVGGYLVSLWSFDWWLDW